VLLSICIMAYQASSVVDLDFTSCFLGLGVVSVVRIRSTVRRSGPKRVSNSGGRVGVSSIEHNPRMARLRLCFSA
jgi:hypothetical protein